MDHQSQSCHRLICAVVNLAVRDLCHSPERSYAVDHEEVPSTTQKPKRNKFVGYRVSSNALDAFNFFYLNNSSDKYLSIIGYDPGAFKKALFNTITGPNHSLISEKDKKNFRYNYFSWYNLVKNDKNFKLPNFALGE